jgi:hypothetical protein
MTGWRRRIRRGPSGSDTLHVARRKQQSDLRSDSRDTRPESSQDRMCAEIIRDLLISISDQTDKHLLRQKLRSIPIDVKSIPYEASYYGDLAVA